MRRRPSSPSEDADFSTSTMKENGAVNRQKARNGSEKETEVGNKTWTAAEESTTKTSTRTQQQNPWSVSFLTLATSFAAIALLSTILYSFLHLQQEPKGCQMSYMMPIFTRFNEFDTEHTRFASKYSLYLYREGGIDEDTRVKGIPVVFIPGNAGSYKQVRPIAAEAAYYYHNEVRGGAQGKLPLDVFSVDFNEDITAFHGQTLLDQAEYLNEAIAFILALYSTPGRYERSSDLPDPRSVIIIGHSMGGMVARTMLTMPNYQEHTINTIMTLAAPHARAPVSFDSTMISTYQTVNDYWRRSHLSNASNPLDEVSLISIAGGGLDTMIPSEYTSVNSIVPASHGFTVFSSGMPNVWTSMDHLAIMWCDQLRKALVKSIFDVVDARRRSQTVARAERVARFQQRLLTGMEPVAKSVTSGVADTTLIIEERLLLNQQKRTIVRKLGAHKAAHIMPVPSEGVFTMLTNERIGGVVEVLLCTKDSTAHPHTLDLSGAGPSARLACKLVNNAVLLPASTASSANAFDDAQPFYYLQIDDTSAGDYVAIVEAQAETHGWLVAEFASSANIQIDKGHHELLLTGLQVQLPASRPLMMEIKIPEVHSTLFAYKLDVQRRPCNASEELFTPLLRQYVDDPYESKYFVNTQGGNINVHGVSPYMPPRLSGKESTDGLSLQIWSDPSCDTTVEISLTVDKLGSAGKIVMRYRTILAVLPLLVVLIVIRKQFKVYDATGFFISFSESMDQCIRTSLPFIFLALTFLAISLSKAAQGAWTHEWLARMMGIPNTLPIDFSTNDFMLGTQDPFLWFLVPLFGIISVGICITANYFVIILMSIIAATYDSIRSLLTSKEAQLRSPNTPFQRIITTAVLLLLVTTLIPYQFAYIVLTMVQFATGVRAMSFARGVQSAAAYNFYNFTHSFLLLMLWVLPINIPVLIVWAHNLAVHWMTPFSTHHNLLAILPLVLCVEMMSSGWMIPRITGRARHITNTITFLIALYAAVYGNTYAYRLHHLLNALAAWLLVLYFASTASLKSVVAEQDMRKTKKRP